LENLDEHTGIHADGQPALLLWSSSSYTNFTDAGGSEELSISIKRHDEHIVAPARVGF
jgi:hypothetical protein